MIISLIVAMTKHRVIGLDNKLPWHQKADLQHFKKLTTGHHILMGRKTFESIGKLLPNRTHIVMSRSDFKHSGVFTFGDSQSAIHFAQDKGEAELFVIGGEAIFKEFLPEANRIYLTEILSETHGDTYFPLLNLKEWKKSEITRGLKDKDNDHDFIMCLYERN